MQHFNYRTIDNGDMALATITSDSINLSSVKHVGLHFYWTSVGQKPNGTLNVMVSNDDINFSPFYTFPISSVSGNSIWSEKDITFAFIKLIYTKSGGTGTLNAYINGKT